MSDVERVHISKISHAKKDPMSVVSSVAMYETLTQKSLSQNKQLSIEIQSGEFV